MDQASTVVLGGAGRQPTLPLTTRVYALAYGTHRRNGHAPFKPGEIALALTTVNTDTGELYVPLATNVTRAIRKAALYGFLSPQSGLRCLVIPVHAISGGMLGRDGEVCRQHRKGGPS